MMALFGGQDPIGAAEGAENDFVNEDWLKNSNDKEFEEWNLTNLT